MLIIIKFVTVIYVIMRIPQYEHVLLGNLYRRFMFSSKSSSAPAQQQERDRA